MTHPSLALCIPAYNATAYLPRLLESALAQTIPFDEIWVYDDCSTDETGKVAAEFGAKVIRGEINRGCSHGKNVLAEHTTCEWIHFHDADDALYPNFVEQAHQWMALENPPDVVLFNYEWRRDDTGELLGIYKFDDAELRRDPIAYTIQKQINPFCGLYRRSAYLQAGGYDTDPLVLYNEDVAFHCRMAIAGLKFAAEPTTTIINYYRANSMSSANQIKCAQAQFHVMRKVSESLKGEYSHEISQKLWGIAGVSAAYLDWNTADSCVNLAFSLHSKTPNHLSALFRLLCNFNPYFAIRFREWLIRFLKPQLRQQIITGSERL
ncbi:glycosyltransferase family 2 protein [Nostoc sp.]|uniref:glycosyltransferase family 2 protein n=1 Tax=Nostoc sp. TaxID=1180 RepID=UPI002FFA246A